MAKGKHRAGSHNHSQTTLTAPPAPAALPEPTDNPLRSPVNRRNAIKTAGAAGVVATSGGVAAGLVGRPETASADTTGYGQPAAGGPVVAYLRAGSTSEVEIFSGETKVVVADGALAARLESAVSGFSGPGRHY